MSDNARVLAWAAVTDVGNRSMRAVARSVWSEDDFNAAAREFNRLWPLETDIRDLRSSTEPVCGFLAPRAALRDPGCPRQPHRRRAGARGSSSATSL